MRSPRASGAGRRPGGRRAGRRIRGYTLLAVAGLVVIVANSATLLTALTVAGAGYLVWLGCGVLRQPAVLTASEGEAGTSRLRIMLRGVGISGLNRRRCCWDS
ncbi:hypothetical protein SGRIM119S_07610 [Streptomyces griseorubiginosus]